MRLHQRTVQACRQLLQAIDDFVGRAETHEIVQQSGFKGVDTISTGVAGDLAGSLASLGQIAAAGVEPRSRSFPSAERGGDRTFAGVVRTL